MNFVTKNKVHNNTFSFLSTIFIFW